MNYSLAIKLAPGWMRQQCRNHPHSSKLIGQRQMPFRSRQIPGETLRIARPAIAGFPADQAPERLPIFARAQPQLSLHRETKFAFRVNQPEPIDRL